MANPPDNISMALFCDFENVALGVRDAQYEKFDIKPVLERLLLKGSIVVKKAYCDWERYKGFKATMHEANFELIEIPHVRQSGKNSADIRLVVDALDLCYTKSHVNTFVIISGDSDFSPLVSKLRENNKQVIGVGVKQSTSDLLIANCDEFIFYDDLVRENQRALARRQTPGTAPAPRRSAEEERHRQESQEARRAQGVDLAVETFEALLSERGDSGKIWASVLKEAIKRRKPDFSESYYGFRTFGNLLEEAQARGLLEFGRDEKSGAYVFRSLASPAAAHAAGRPEAPAERPGSAGYFRHGQQAPSGAEPSAGERGEGGQQGGRGRGRRNDGNAHVQGRADAQGTHRHEFRPDNHGDLPEDMPAERPAGSYFLAQPKPQPQLSEPESESRAQGHGHHAGPSTMDREPQRPGAVTEPAATEPAETAGTAVKAAADALPTATAPARRRASAGARSDGRKTAPPDGVESEDTVAPAVKTTAAAKKAAGKSNAAAAPKPAKAPATRSRKPPAKNPEAGE